MSTVFEASYTELCEAKAEIDRLTAQLPDGMKHCTIQFKECELGHGRLTATNWIDHGCPYCQIAKLRVAFEDANQMCRSAHEIAKRVGLQTNWPAFRNQLDKSLQLQQAALNEETK